MTFDTESDFQFLVPNVSQGCAPPSLLPASLEPGSSCSFLLEGVLLVVVAFVGLLGNFLSILVLSMEEKKNCFNCLLISLGVFDTVFLVLVTLDYSFARALNWPLDLESEVYILLFPKLIYPINNISFTCSTYITVSIAYERYLAVCKPHVYREIERSNTVMKRMVYYVVVVVILGIVINLPRFFETQFVRIEEETDLSLFGDWNLTDAMFADQTDSLLQDSTEQASLATSRLSFELSALRNDPDYIRYYINIFRLMATWIIPLSTLLFFYIKIYLGIRYSHVRSRKSKAGNEMNMAAILICILTIFLLSNIPRVVLNCFEFYMLDIIIRCGDHFIPPNWFLCLASFNNLALVFNASVNFIIYCSVGEKFRESFKQIIFHSHKIKSESPCDV